MGRARDGRLAGCARGACLVVLASAAALAGDDPAAPPASDGSAAFEAEVAAAFAPFEPKLLALGEWCEFSTLILERSRVADALILLEPENERARGWLRYRRQKDGTWALTSAKPFFDEKAELLPEWEKRRAEVAGPMRAALEPFLERRDDWRTAGVRDRILRALVALDPDDTMLHDTAGETLVGGRWRLKESVATAEGRRRIAAAASDAEREAAKAAKDFAQKPSDFASCVGPPDFTVKSTMPLADATAVAADVLAARFLYERVLDTRVHFRRGFVVHDFAKSADAASWIEARADVSEEKKRAVRRRTTYWPTPTEVVVSADDAEKRTDQCVRQVLSAMGGDVVELMSAPAWMGEGFGMYLTHALVGTRLTVLVRETKYSDDSVARELADPKADWVQAVRRVVLEKGAAPNLRVLIGLPMNSMTTDDTLMAYALSAYFLEGRPRDALLLLEELKDKRPCARALADVCDFDADGLEARFVRWLRETK